MGLKINMIKAILFDLDGVLVDACDWHYKALNKALKISGYYEINKQDHMITYNGLPTQIKLEMMGITGENSKKINRLKQDFTLETIKNNAKIMKEKKELHTYLKKHNILIACVTNSIRETAEEMLRCTGQLKYMDLLITNEDVERNKPHPDCYNLAIKQLNVDPNDVLCVEDSEHGIQAAKNSLAKHIVIVKNTTEVTINRLVEYLL